jgi:outer membrane protein OmpU
MKNLLIATTALVATGSVAAADITFSGGGRFGVVHTGSVTTAATAATGDSGEISDAEDAVTSTAGFAAISAKAVVDNTADGSLTATDIEDAESDAFDAANAVAALDAIDGTAASTSKSATDMVNRITFNINGSAETDSGVEFFGKVRIRGGNEGDKATKNTVISAPRVGMKIGSLTVAVGNINGAIDSMPNLYGGTVGLTGLGYTNVVSSGVDGFSSTGGGSNGVEVIYSANGFGFHMSHSSLIAGDRTALHVSYAFGDWKLALGHQAADLATEEQTILTVGGSLGSIDLGMAYADRDDSLGNALRVSTGFEVAAGTKVTLYVMDADKVGSDTAYGLGFTHSLGGATLAGGVASKTTGQTVADLGVRFNF